MRISLEPDPAEFVKQVADLRRFLNRVEAKGGQEVITSRFMTASYVPFLATLRAELRSKDVSPAALMTALSDLMGNLAMTLVQSMYDAPPDAESDAIDRLLGGARITAGRMIENDARMARDEAAKGKPSLVIIDGGKNGS